MQVRVAGDHVVAEPLSIFNAFEPLPWDECIPVDYFAGGRRVLRVDDGWLVAYTSPLQGELSWVDDNGTHKRTLSSARVVGFARAPSGTILALAIGRARLGRGGVLALDAATGYAPRLVATLPIEPSAAAFDDHGRLVGFAKGFVFAIDETGKLENAHYIPRDLGRVASIASAAGAYYLGLECGVLRIGADGAQTWWSARNGASGRWTRCLESR
jgi:hypothetical protein